MFRKLIVNIALPILFLGAQNLNAFTVGNTNADVLPFPVIAYGPDTSFMLGGAGFFIFRPVDKPEVKPDSIQIVAFYALKHQYMSTLAYKKYFLDGKLYNKGSASYMFWPSEFYGVGPDTSYDNEERYEARNIPLRQLWMYNFFSEFYAGISYNYAYFAITKTESGKVLQRENIIGTKPTVVSAPGFKLARDTRDNDFYTYSGSYAAVSGYINNIAFGATEDFTRFKMVYKHFFQTISQEHIYGFHVVGVSQQGQVPLNTMQSIGGGFVLRGFTESRYIDKCKYSVQNEFRFPFPGTERGTVLGRFRGAVFAGFANIAPSISDFRNDTLRSSAGAGLRFALNEEEVLNLRLDFAYNSDNKTGVHFLIMEAF